MKLTHLFKYRISKQWQTYFKYLRYVFNDHAVLALFFLLGAAGLAYQSLWQTAVINIWTQLALIIVILLTFLIFKGPANFTKPADATALLGDETSLRVMLKQATYYSMMVNGVVEGILILLLWPMIFRLFTHSIFLVTAITIILVLLKILLTYFIAKQQSKFENQENSKLVNWRRLIAAEENHQFVVLSFYNLFIDVPGITPRVKRQKWADLLINHWPGRQIPTTKLFVTAFIRRTQYIKLWLRLTVIGAGAAWFTTGWLQTILLLILLYLLVLQLIPLYDVHKHIVFNFLYPISDKQRLKAFQITILPWICITIIFWLIIAFIATFNINLLLQNFLSLVLLGGILVFWYTEQKTIKSTQRRHTRAFTK